MILPRCRRQVRRNGCAHGTNDRALVAANSFAEATDTHHKDVAVTGRRQCHRHGTGVREETRVGDRVADWHDLAVATDAVRAGAPLIVPNRDANYPDPGRLVPGTGAAVAALEAATGVRAMAIGKPAPDLLLQAAALDGSDIRDAIMIGDSPATDIAAANAAGCRSILLMTGVGAGVGAVQIGDLPEAQRPTWVARDAAEMAGILAAVTASGVARG